MEGLQSAVSDIVKSVEATRIWFVLGLNDVLARYRGSILGPFWITLTTAIFVLGIGFLYAGLMKVSLERYLPWMTTGLVVWNLISQTVLESSEAFVNVSNVMRQTNFPAPIFVWRVVWRNVLTFLHQAPVLLVIAIKFGYIGRIHWLEALAGLFLILLNLTWFSLACAIVCARFRDLKQILASMTQLLFFLSPVLWIPNEMKGVGGKLLALNPVVHMLNVLRGPLIGEGMTVYGCVFLLVSAAAGWVLTVVYLAHVRRRIVHYI